MVNFTIDKVNEILAQLKGLRIKEAVSLRKRLQKEKQKLVPKIKEPVASVSASAQKQIANNKRSIKQKRNFRFARQIRNFFPEMSILDIRREIAKRKRGEPSSIPDAVFQNPSP